MGNDVVKLLKEELVKMEDDAMRYYKIADEYWSKDKRKSDFYRQQGNLLMERVVVFKQIMECGRELEMTEAEKHLYLDGNNGLAPYLRLKGRGMPQGKVRQIAWLLLNGSGCGFCKVCRDEPCNIKDGEGCTSNIENYIREIVLKDYEHEIRNKIIEEFAEAFIYKAVCSGCSTCCNCYENGHQQYCEDYKQYMEIAASMKGEKE